VEGSAIQDHADASTASANQEETEMATKKGKTKKTNGKGKAAKAKAPKPAAKASEAKKGKPANGKSKPTKSKPTEQKRVSALDAAAQVLAKAGKPMKSRELIAAMADQGLWQSPGGKTPWATLYSAMIREISTAGKASRFKKVDRGAFALSGKEA
jgi:hypothetical protein